MIVDLADDEVDVIKDSLGALRRMTTKAIIDRPELADRLVGRKLAALDRVLAKLADPE